MTINKSCPKYFVTNTLDILKNFGDIGVFLKTLDKLKKDVKVDGRMYRNLTSVLLANGISIVSYK